MVVYKEQRCQRVGERVKEKKTFLKWCLQEAKASSMHKKYSAEYNSS